MYNFEAALYLGLNDQKPREKIEEVNHKLSRCWIELVRDKEVWNEKALH